MIGIPPKVAPKSDAIPSFLRSTLYVTHTVVEAKDFVHFSHPRRQERFAKKAIVDIIVVLGRTFKGRCQTRTIILFLLDPPNSTSDHSKLLGMLPLNL